jgi:hypothetical protein
MLDRATLASDPSADPEAGMGRKHRLSFSSSEKRNGSCYQSTCASLRNDTSGERRLPRASTQALACAAQTYRRTLDSATRWPWHLRFQAHVNPVRRMSLFPRRLPVCDQNLIDKLHRWSDSPGSAALRLFLASESRRPTLPELPAGCTPSFRATPFTVPGPCSYSRRICSNNSTVALFLAIRPTPRLSFKLLA